MANPFFDLLFGGGASYDFKPKVWAPGEREAFWEEQHAPAKWQPWRDDLKWAPTLLIKGESYAPKNLFPEVVPSRGGAQGAVSDSTTHAASASGRWVYANQILPAFTPLRTFQGRRRGEVVFDKDVLIPSIYERHLVTAHETRFIMPPDYDPTSPAFTLPIGEERVPVQKWRWRNLPFGSSTPSPWMSFTPMEMLTLRPGVEFARGHTIVAGLGLGWQLEEVAKNPKVTRITLLERDQEIVDFILPRLTIKKPLDVVIGDAYETITRVQADTALIDIFPSWGNIGLKMVKFKQVAPQIKRWWGWGRGWKS